MTNDVRTLLTCAVPTVITGAVAVVVSGLVAGGKGATGAGAGTALAVLFMGVGLVALQRTAKSLPQLFQAMGMMIYTAQLLLLLVVLASFKHTTLFNLKAFAFSVLATSLVWIAAQGRAHMKAKILYVDSEPSEARRPVPAKSSS